MYSVTIIARRPGEGQREGVAFGGGIRSVDWRPQERGPSVSCQEVGQH